MKSALFNIRIDNTLRSKFRVRCQKDGVTMSDVVKALIAEYVEGKIVIKKTNTKI